MNELLENSAWQVWNATRTDAAWAEWRFFGLTENLAKSEFGQHLKRYVADIF